MARFDLLPAELQIQIFNYLQGPDIKAARAVSRKLHDNATPALFRSIVACGRYQAMGAFQKISLHSVYSSYVKEIIFDGSVYEARLARYETTYFRAQDQVEDLRFGSHWGKRSRWKRYQELYQEQEDMKASGVLLQTIARSLEWMHNVSSVVYSPHPHSIPVEAKVMRDLLPRSTSTPCTSSDHAFRQLIGAIYLSEYAGIRDFTVEAYRKGNPGTEFSLSLFDFPDPVDLQAGRYFFQHLLKLELSMSLQTFGESGTSARGLRQLSNVANLLTAAKDLRHLALHITHWIGSRTLMYGHILSNEQPIFSYFGLRATWQKLRSLSLGGMYADEQDITDFIKHHKYTLRSLAFTQCSLCSGTWVEIVDEVVYNSIVVSFVLDLVNETDLPGMNWMSLSTEDKERWRYEGHLVVSKDGERSFIDSNASKQSVYELRR
ncbi:Nn.00g018480.m01.CDS01 [Neocucurbitaria sp. VM-36]